MRVSISMRVSNLKSYVLEPAICTIIHYRKFGFTPCYFYLVEDNLLAVLFVSKTTIIRERLLDY